MARLVSVEYAVDEGHTRYPEHNWLPREGSHMARLFPSCPWWTPPSTREWLETSYTDS
jgi:hypothetical protein